MYTYIIIKTNKSNTRKQYIYIHTKNQTITTQQHITYIQQNKHDNITHNIQQQTHYHANRKQ